MKTLEELVKERSRERGLLKAIKEIYELVEKGKLKLVDPNPPKTFASYLANPSYTLWLWTALSLTALTIASITISTHAPQTKPLRYVLGTIYTLFLPGYSLTEALYPEKQSLKPIERLALSIGLSLAIIPLLGLLLNYTPWGIRLNPITAAITTFITTMLLTAAYRKYRLLTLKIHTTQKQNH